MLCVKLKIFMQFNWLLISIVVVAAIALIVFLIKRNFKDKNSFKKKLNNDYHKPSTHESETH